MFVIFQRLKMTKDKRTYTNIKEHGEDISHENETRQALYREVKNLKNKIEKILKDQDLKNDQHTIDILEKDVEINKLKKSQCQCASVQSVKKDQL